MTVGLCVCAVLAVLCSRCFGLPFSPQAADEDQRYFSVSSEAVFEADAPTLGETHLRNSRSSPQLKPFSQAEEDADSRVNLLRSRKSAVHDKSKIQKKDGQKTKPEEVDTDYFGWMDFGRRSAEEFEYAS